MYDFCARHGVPHVRSGKLIVAARRARGRSSSRRCSGAEPRNGVAGLEIVDRAFIVQREPAVSTRFALWSPDSGIVNAEEYVKALLRAGCGRRRRCSCPVPSWLAPSRIATACC